MPAPLKPVLTDCAALCSAVLGKPVTVERIPKILRHVTSRQKFDDLVEMVKTHPLGSKKKAKELAEMAEPWLMSAFPLESQL